MTNQYDLKAMPDPEPLALRIATRAAFLASKTAKDVAISTLAQQSAEHAQLQELHRGLMVQFEQRETQILDLKEVSASAQTVWAEERRDLQRVAKAARFDLSQHEAEHACLKKRYQDCLAELEREDAEILDLHSTVQSLSLELDDAAHSVSAQHEAEITRLQTLLQRRTAELEEASSQITERDRTIERLRQECSDLTESEAGAQEYLAGRRHDLLHATDAAALSRTQHDAEQSRLQDLIHEQDTQLEEKETQILGLQTTIEDLESENSKLNQKCFSGRDCLNYLVKFGIFLDRTECDLLTQSCHDKRAAS
jgi:chromosome segregation ATPase